MVDETTKISSLLLILLVSSVRGWPRTVRPMVHLHGQRTVTTTKSLVTRTLGLSARITGLPQAQEEHQRPPDPQSLFSSQEELEAPVGRLLDFWRDKQNIFCITGAGLSTESGIPDYRGNNGSYHRGHKPMIHQQYMESEYQRKRYWGRSMVGWKGFDGALSNPGHVALAELERKGWLGVTMKDRPEYYEPDQVDEYYLQSTGERKVALVTQNVDVLHERAGSREVIHLHGQGDILRCMQCGAKQDRNEFHMELEYDNAAWLEAATEDYDESTEMRPDGDALVKEVDYNEVHVPNCPHCKTGFFKPDVVFFGDTVPKHRVAICQGAVDAADGILVVGTSLAVHSAFRHIRAASSRGIPIAILNVGETRAELEGLDHLLKVEAPAGDTLSLLVQKLTEMGKTV